MLGDPRRVTITRQRFAAAADRVCVSRHRSCLDDSTPHVRWVTKRPCISAVADLLQSLLVPRARTGVSVRPPLMARATPLRQRYSDAFPFDDKESTGMRAAFRQQSRVVSFLAGCAVNNATCRTPLVPPPRWLPAVASVADVPRNGADQADAPPDREGVIRALSGLPHEPRSYDDAHHAALYVPLQLVALALVAVIWGSIRRRRRVRRGVGASNASAGAVARAV